MRCFWFADFGPRLEYASDFRVGGCYLRPHMLGYRADFGYAACCEPEDLMGLTQLILSEGCMA